LSPVVVAAVTLVVVALTMLAYHLVIGMSFVALVCCVICGLRGADNAEEWVHEVYALFLGW